MHFLAEKKGNKDALQKERSRKPIIEAASQSIILSKFQSVRVESVTNDLRKGYLSILKFPNYRRLSEHETIQALKSKGFDRIFIPRD